MKNIIGTISNEKNLDLLYSVFDDLIILNDNNGLDINAIINILSYDIKQKYFLNLIKNKEMRKYWLKIKEEILSFLIYNDKDCYRDPETIISLILNCEDDEFRCDILNDLKKMILKYEDFYNIEENDNFIFFKLFTERCKNLIDIVEVNSSVYYSEMIALQNKIENDLKTKNIPYNITYTTFLAHTNGDILLLLLIIFSHRKKRESKL